MSIFNNILEKLGIKKPAAPAITAKPVAPSAPTGPVTPGASAKLDHMATPGPRPTSFTPMAAPKPIEMPMVDVVSKLYGLAKANPMGLDWKVSINDLMALLGMDHKAEDIKALAVELGCPESEMGDSYKRNVWTHKALLKEIAKNGGNIPPKLLD
jgi:hypothetical protein